MIDLRDWMIIGGGLGDVSRDWERGIDMMCGGLGYLGGVVCMHRRIVVCGFVRMDIRDIFSNGVIWCFVALCTIVVRDFAGTRISVVV